MGLTFYSFRFMVMLGMLMFLLSLTAVWISKRDRLESNPLFLKVMVAAIALPYIVVQLGWIVAEVGRQPWIVQGVLRTADAVTPMPGLIVPFLLFTVLYVFLGVIVAYLLMRQFAVAPTQTGTFRRPTPPAGTTPAGATAVAAGD